MEKYIRDSKGNWMRKDGKPITRDDAAELIKLSYPYVAKKYEKSPNPKFHRSEDESELKFSFSQAYEQQVKHYDNVLFEEVNRARKLKTIEQCRKAIQVYEDAQRFCYSKGTGGRLYFDDMWEFCHNSRHQCFSFIQEIRDLLQRLEQNK